MMRKYLLVIALLFVCLTQYNFAQTSGNTMPSTCTAGASFTLTSVVPNIYSICSPNNKWVGFDLNSTSITMPDNVATSLFTVALPTTNTGCAVLMSFYYTATSGVNNVAHSCVVMWAFTNQNGVVEGDMSETGDVVVGNGCGTNCDDFTTTISGTTGTAKANFNNSLSVNGALTIKIINSTCPTVTFQ